MKILLDKVWQKISLMLILLLFISVNSCAFKNKPTVDVVIDSDPTGSKLMINGKKYGVTPVKMAIVPTGQYKIILERDGYQYEFDLVSQLGPRLNKDDNKRCIVDAATSFLLVPTVSLYSSRCRDFEYRAYNFRLRNSLMKNDRSIATKEERSKVAPASPPPKSQSSKSFNSLIIS